MPQPRPARSGAPNALRGGLGWSCRGPRTGIGTFRNRLGFALRSHESGRRRRHRRKMSAHGHKTLFPTQFWHFLGSEWPPRWAQVELPRTPRGIPNPQNWVRISFSVALVRQETRASPEDIKSRPQKAVLDLILTLFRLKTASLMVSLGPMLSPSVGPTRAH